MKEATFQSEMRRLTSDPTEADYYAGFIRGLRRAYHGERFGTEAEHVLWLTLADSEDEQRAARGKGYRDGLNAKAQEVAP